MNLIYFWMSQALAVSYILGSNQSVSLQIYLVPGLLMLVPELLAFSYIQPLIDKGFFGVAIQSFLSTIIMTCALHL